MAIKIFVKKTVMFAFTVFRVADNRMADMFKVFAQLVLSACFRVQFDQWVTTSRKPINGMINLKCAKSMISGNGVLSRLFSDFLFVLFKVSSGIAWVLLWMSFLLFFMAGFFCWCFFEQLINLFFKEKKLNKKEKKYFFIINTYRPTKKRGESSGGCGCPGIQKRKDWVESGL